MKNYRYYSVLAAIAVIAPTFLNAQTIIVETRTGGQNLNWYSESGGNWANSTLKSSAAGVTAGIGSRFETTEGATFSVTPVLEDGAIYAVDITQGSTATIAERHVIGIELTGATGLPADTTVFRLSGANTWERIGFMTNNPGVTTPVIKFSRLAGSTGDRWYADTIRFTKFDPCFNGLPQLITVNGPLGAGQTFVEVPAVAATATAVSVYANGVRVGQKTSGVTAGVNRVTLDTPLTKNAMVTVTQTDAGGIESCRPSVGTLVGGGANPGIKVALSIRQSTTEAGPIGRDGGATITLIKFLGATGVVNNINGNAPVGNRAFSPSSDWQTVEFLRGPDPANPTDGSYTWNGTPDANPNQLKGDFGIVDSVVFYMNELDSGPYAFYIDSFMNGSTLIQGFEGVAPGGSAGFVQPSFSGTTSPFLLSPAPGAISPNVSVVTNNTSDTGAHSLFTSFQFKDTNSINWLRFVAQGAGSPNPVVDLRQPISFRMLLMPVGEVPPPTAPYIPAGPADQRVLRGGTATMRVNVRGLSPFTYQWRHEGVDIPNATSATLTVTNAQAANGGSYTVYIQNALGNAVSPAGTLTVEDVPFTDIMTPAWRLATGSRTYLANDNSTRSLAFSPQTGNLLLASRSGGATNIYVLDGETGDFKFTMQQPAGGYSGGTFTLSQVAVTDDGSVYACNLTDDGATTNLKIYKWFGDYDNEPGTLVWEGNPGANPDLHVRWGDAMVVRTGSGTHEIILSSRTGALLSLIQPDFGPNSAAVVTDVTGAPSNGFRTGLAAQGLDIIWGKIPGLPLLKAQTDFSSGASTLLNSFSGLNNMGPIGVNTDGTLLAGVFIDTPDHLRLFDISTPGQITALDTEFFPSDNANGNATGGVAFGNNKVYALDSNNGLIAMNIDTACLPDKLTIETSGSDVILRWNRPAYQLQGTTTLGSGWAPIAGGSPKTISASGNQFFRLVCPAAP